MWATPLQLATATAIMANRGKVVEPRLLKAVGGEAYEPEPANPVPDIEVEDPDYWRYIQESMTMVVHRPYSDTFRDYGTAYEPIAMADRDMAYTMAGKSGTAQVVGISQDVLSSEDIDVSALNRDHALFVSFAPAMHKSIEPQIAIAVFVENGEHGSSIAGPIAKAVTDTYLLEILGLEFEAMEEAGEAERLVSQADE